MPMNWNKYYGTAQDVGRGVHNLNTGVIKIALSNTAPDLTDVVLADAVEITAGFGYTAGGATVGATSFTQTAGVGKLLGNAVTFTAAGGDLGPFRYLIVYNSTPSGGPLLGWWDYGAALTLHDGDSLTVGKDTAGGNWDVGSPILTLT